MNRDHPLWNDAFPRANQYDADWVMANEMGPNALWLTEWLCREMRLEPGMRVLDLGCGRALSSVFLAREFGVQVWAADLWCKPTDNWARIRAAGLEDRIYPIEAEAHALPFAKGYFDAIVCVDAYIYFGTDDVYLGRLREYVVPGGEIGIVVPGLMREFEGGVVPEHLTRPQANGGVFWAPDCWSYHTADWWRDHWARTGLVEVTVADTMPDGVKHWIQFEHVKELTGAGRFPPDTEVFEADGGRYLGFVRMVARRNDK